MRRADPGGGGIIVPGNAGKVKTETTTFAGTTDQRMGLSAHETL